MPSGEPIHTVVRARRCSNTRLQVWALRSFVRPVYSTVPLRCSIWLAANCTVRCESKCSATKRQQRQWKPSANERASRVDTLQRTRTIQYSAKTVQNSMYCRVQYSTVSTLFLWESGWIERGPHANTGSAAARSKHVAYRNVTLCTLLCSTVCIMMCKL